MAAKFVSGFGRSGEPVKFITAGPGARDKARQFARSQGGRVYQAVAVCRVISVRAAFNLGSGYIVATTPPRGFVYWRRYFAKIMDIQDMSEKERRQYISARGAEVFGERKNYASWLKTPIKALGYKTPESFMMKKKGVEMVLDILERIEHGVYS
jgi:hypothetical protein